MRKYFTLGCGGRGLDLDLSVRPAAASGNLGILESPGFRGQTTPGNHRVVGFLHIGRSPFFKIINMLGAFDERTHWDSGLGKFAQIQYSAHAKWVQIKSTSQHFLLSRHLRTGI